MCLYRCVRESVQIFLTNVNFCHPLLFSVLSWFTQICLLHSLFSMLILFLYCLCRHWVEVYWQLNTPNLWMNHYQPKPNPSQSVCFVLSWIMTRLRETSHSWCRNCSISTPVCSHSALTLFLSPIQKVTFVTLACPAWVLSSWLLTLVFPWKNR